MHTSLVQQIALLKSMVDINSGTANVTGVNEIQQLVKRELQTMGFDVELIRDPKGQYGNFLIATFGKKSKSGTIDFVTHADTVFEKESGFLSFEFNAAKTTAKGPGVIDDKGGIVVALEGIKKYLKERPAGGLRFICSSCEEVGSPPFQKLLKNLGRESKMILGFEPAMDDGSIVDARKGNRWYHIKVRGKAAHAGRGHEEGINAAHELGYKITKLDKLTDYKKEVTVSVGAISGGSKFNIVCPEAQAKVDVRFSDHQCMNDTHKKIMKILSSSHLNKNSGGEKPKTTFDITDDCPPFSKNKSSTKYINHYLKLVREVEKKKIKSVECGGSADSNYMSHEGLVIIDGLGAIGHGMHTLGETIVLSSLETRAEILYRLLRDLT